MSISVLENSNHRARPEYGSRRYACVLSRAVFREDATRFTVLDQDRCILGGPDEATITFETDVRVSNPCLFVGEGLGSLFDAEAGADQSYFERLEAIASLALDPDHARRALNIDGERQ